MTYVTDGKVVAKRSPWRLSIVTDMFWGVVGFVGLFVTSLFSVSSMGIFMWNLVLLTGSCLKPTEMKDISTALRPNSNIRQDSAGNGRGGPRRPMGGVNRRGTVNMPMGGGGCCG